MFLKAIKYLFWGGLCSIALSGGVLAGAYYSTLDELPDVEELKHVSFETPMKIYTKDNKLIGEFGEHKRIPVTLDQIPEKMQQAFLAIEDSRFYEHSGVDPVGILRAMVVAVTSGGASQGASTITQQVARNFFLSRDRTIERKIKEIFIAWRIEQVLSKEEILELYLNKIALGHRSYGVVAAAQTYYGKTLDQLTLAEIATIAGLPKAPSTLNPITSPERAKNRRHLVLQRMLSLGMITPEEFKTADTAPSKTFFHSAPLEAYAPYVAEEARQYVIDKYGEEAYIKGIKVYTTVDSRYQDYAHKALVKNLINYDERHGYRGPWSNIYDPSRGISGSAKAPTEKNGKNANANNGVIMQARQALADAYAASGRKADYLSLVSQVNDKLAAATPEAPAPKAQDQQTKSTQPVSTQAYTLQDDGGILANTSSQGLSQGQSQGKPATSSASSTPNQQRGPVYTLGNVKYAEQNLDSEAILELIRKADRFESIKPALVINIDDEQKTALLLNAEGKTFNLNWDGMSWARAFKTDRYQGEAPKYPSEFLVKGDIIYTYQKMVDPNEGKWVPKGKEKPLYEATFLTQVPDVEGALIAIDPHNGAIRAMSGGFDFEKSKFNRTTQLLRQTGSNFKPFIYSAAIAYGLTPNSVIPDEPIRTWDAGSRRWWQPRNSPNRYEGLMTMRTGLAKSKNSVSIRIIRQIGVENTVEHLKKFDIHVPKFQQSESMALGSMELTPAQVATAYATFANGGYKLTPYLIDRIELEDGQVLYKANPPIAFYDLPDIVENSIPLVYKPGVDPQAVAEAAVGLLGPKASEAANSGPISIAPQIVPHAHAYIVSSMLHSVIYGGTGLGGVPFYGTGSRAARITGRDDLNGKTGTTNNVHDAWFSGFNANLVCTAWVGFDNDRDLGYSRTKGSESGSATALPIFADFFKSAQEGVPSSPIPKPAGMTWVTNRGISEPAIPGMRVVDNGNSASSMQNVGIDSSEVEDNNIF